MKLEQYFQSNTQYFRDEETQIRYKLITRFGMRGDIIDTCWQWCDEELDEWVNVSSSKRQELEDAVKISEWHRIVGDDSGHEYVIPSDKDEEWDTWLQDEEAVAYGGLPIYATRVEGIEFRQWRES